MIYKLFQGSLGIKLKRYFVVFLKKLLHISCLPSLCTHKKEKITKVLRQHLRSSMRAFRNKAKQNKNRLVFYVISPWPPLFSLLAAVPSLKISGASFSVLVLSKGQISHLGGFLHCSSSSFFHSLQEAAQLLPCIFIIL